MRFQLLKKRRGRTGLVENAEELFSVSPKVYRLRVAAQK